MNRLAVAPLALLILALASPAAAKEPETIHFEAKYEQDKPFKRTRTFSLKSTETVAGTTKVITMKDSSILRVTMLQAGNNWSPARLKLVFEEHKYEESGVEPPRAYSLKGLEAEVRAEARAKDESRFYWTEEPKDPLAKDAAQTILFLENWLSADDDRVVGVPFLLFSGALPPMARILAGFPFNVDIKVARVVEEEGRRIAELSVDDSKEGTVDTSAGPMKSTIRVKRRFHYDLTKGRILSWVDHVEVDHDLEGYTGRHVVDLENTFTY